MTKKERRYFGTDGIRGKVGIAPISADWALKLGWAVGCVLKAQKKTTSNARPRILIGKDTRISGYMFESALEAGLCAAGVDPGLLGPMPTPAIAYLTRLKADAGIVISASHNPYADNGFKFFSADGTKLSDALELAIEAQLDKPMTTVSATQLGKAFRVVDAVEQYQQFCESIFLKSPKLSGLTLVVDCANGATYHIAPNLLSRLGANVISIHVQPDGLNINEACGATYPSGLQAAVLAEKADLGIAFDGDGDRVVMVDHTGMLVDGDELLFILATQYQALGCLERGVVGTQMSNLGLEMACQAASIPFYRSKVGDRHVLKMMQNKAINLGGESSGHLICADVSTTGDGLIAALRILEIMQIKHQSLHTLKQGMKKYPQALINVPLLDMIEWDTCDQIQTAVQSAEKSLKGQGRVLLRSSGTEPLVRVMVEGQDAVLVDRLAQDLANVVKTFLGAAGANTPLDTNLDLPSTAH
jgi:phosphoglucosamine mutase